MKKLQTSLLAIALALGISGAIAANLHARPKAADPTYNWSSTSIAPMHPNSVLLNATRADAVMYFGCDIGSNLCATGVPIAGGPNEQLKFN